MERPTYSMRKTLFTLLRSLLCKASHKIHFSSNQRHALAVWNQTAQMSNVSTATCVHAKTVRQRRDLFLLSQSRHLLYQPLHWKRNSQKSPSLSLDKIIQNRMKSKLKIRWMVTLCRRVSFAKYVSASFKCWSSGSGRPLLFCKKRTNSGRFTKSISAKTESLSP